MEGREHSGVLFLSDCKEVVGLIKKEGALRNLGGLTLDRINRAMQNHKNWHIGHISREHNLAAHFLAKSVNSLVDSPDWIDSRVNADLKSVWSHFM